MLKTFEGMNKKKPLSVIQMFGLLGWGMRRAPDKNGCEEKWYLPSFPCSPI